MNILSDANHLKRMSFSYNDSLISERIGGSVCKVKFLIYFMGYNECTLKNFNFFTNLDFNHCYYWHLCTRRFKMETN